MQVWILLKLKDQISKAFIYLLIVGLPTKSYSQIYDEQSILSRLDNTLDLAYNNKVSKRAKIDSLKRYFCKLDIIQNDSTRLRNKFKIINRLVYINADSLEKKYINKVKDEALYNDNQYNLAKAYDYLGSFYLKKQDSSHKCNLWIK